MVMTANSNFVVHLMRENVSQRMVFNTVLNSLAVKNAALIRVLVPPVSAEQEVDLSYLTEGSSSVLAAVAISADSEVSVRLFSPSATQLTFKDLFVVVNTDGFDDDPLLYLYNSGSSVATVEILVFVT